MVEVPGFASADSKRRLTRSVWVSTLFTGIVQIVGPAALIAGAVLALFVDACDAPTPNLRAPAVANGALWYTVPAPKPKDAPDTPDDVILLRAALVEDGGVEEVTRLGLAIGSFESPQLLAHDGAIWIVGNDALAIFTAGAEPPVRNWTWEANLPSTRHLLVHEGAPAIVSVEGYDDERRLVVRRFVDGVWEISAERRIEWPWASVDRLRAVSASGRLDIVASTYDDELLHVVWTDHEGPRVEVLDADLPTDEWALAGNAEDLAFYALVEGEEEPELETYRAWKRVDRTPAPSAYRLGAVSTADGDIVAVDAMFDDVTVRRVSAGGTVVETIEHSRSNPWPKTIALVVLSQLLPSLLTLLVALFLSGRMRAHRALDETARYASLAQRGLAKVVDATLQGIVPLAVVAPTLLESPERFGNGHVFLMAIASIPLFVVFSYAEGRWGVTPGKRLFGIRVVDENDGPCGFGPAMLRNVLSVADGLFNFLVGVVSVALSQKWQRIGDKAAHTIVVRA